MHGVVYIYMYICNILREKSCEVADTLLLREKKALKILIYFPLNSASLCPPNQKRSMKVYPIVCTHGHHNARLEALCSVFRIRTTGYPLVVQTTFQLAIHIHVCIEMCVGIFLCQPRLHSCT